MFDTAFKHARKVTAGFLVLMNIFCMAVIFPAAKQPATVKKANPALKAALKPVKDNTPAAKAEISYAPIKPPPHPSPAGKTKRGSVLSSRGLDSGLEILARVIYAESRGEPFSGQVAVGAVILNRLRNPAFPSTIEGIVYKRGEFCTVRDGQINLRPDAEAFRAAELAVKGWDPSGGALYFYNPAKTTSRWIWSRQVTVKIGRHVFAR